MNSLTKNPGGSPWTSRRSLSGLSIATAPLTIPSNPILRIAALLGGLLILAIYAPHGFTQAGFTQGSSDGNEDSNSAELRGHTAEMMGPEILQMEILPGNTDRPVVTAMELSPDGRYLAAAGDDHAVRLLELSKLSSETSTLSFATMSSSSDSSFRGNVARADRSAESTPVSRQTWQCHSDWVRSVRFSPSGNLMASCGNDGKIVVFDVLEKRPVASTQVTHALHDICFIDDSILYAVGFDANVYRWDISQSQPKVDHQADCRDLRTIQYSPELKMLAYGGRDGVLRLYRVLEDKIELYALSPAHFQRIRSLHFLNDQQTLLSVGEDRRLIQYDTKSKAIISTLDFPGGKLFGLAAIDVNQLAVGGADNTIRILDAKSGYCNAKLIGHDGTITLLHARGEVLVSSSFDTTIRIWNVERATKECDELKRYHHPVAAQFEDSGALEKPGILVSRPIK
ncbi:MAG: WD40 repeat domain-containing protein [Pirellula sp.]